MSVRYPSMQSEPAREGIGFRWQAAGFLAALVDVFSRVAGAFLHPQFFAQDGWVWYHEAYNLHWLRSLGIAQAGYLQTFPRLVTGLALLFPMQWAPLIMSLAGAVIQVLPVTALLSRRCAPWGPLHLRILMAALYLAIPDAPEIHIVLTNAMWHLAVLQALLAFSLPPLTWRGRVSDGLLFAIGAISGPFCLLLLPCIAAWWWLRRQRWTLTAMGITFLGASRRHPSAVVTNHGRQYFYRQHDRHRWSVFADFVAHRCWYWRADDDGMGLAQRPACGTPLYLLRHPGSDRVPERPSPPTRHHASLGGARECYWNPLLVPALTDVSMVRSMVRVGRREQVGAACRDGRPAAYPGGRLSRMALPVLAG